MSHICPLEIKNIVVYCDVNNREDYFVSQFGRKVKELREQKNLTQLDLAAKTNMPIRQIGRIERGEVNTTITASVVIAAALDVHVKILFDFE